MRDGLGPSDVVPRRSGGGTPESDINLRNLPHKRGRHDVAGSPGPCFPGKTVIRQGSCSNQVLRGRGNPLDLFSPRAPRRVCRTRGLPRGIATPLEGLPLRGTRDPRGGPPRAVRGPGRKLTRGARAVRAGWRGGEGVARGTRGRLRWRGIRGS